MTAITRTYASADNAARAVKRLKAEGFTDDLMTLSGPGASAATEPRWTVSVRPPFGMGRTATELMDRFEPVAGPVSYERDPDPDLQSISRLSRSVSPGAIAELSRCKPTGAISSLSRAKSPGAISRLSRSRSPGSVARLSRTKPPGAISRLSRASHSGSIAALSAGWYFSKLLGLPLLTKSQKPVEPDDSLLVHERGRHR
jgi:hypothetical protein